MQVDEGAACMVVAVVGELAAVEPDADGAGSHAGRCVGGVGVDEDGLLHVPMMRQWCRLWGVSVCWVRDRFGGLARGPETRNFPAHARYRGRNRFRVGVKP